MSVLKRAARFIFSDLGLTILLMLYAALGAFILRAVETGTERKALRGRWEAAMDIEYKRREIRDYIIRIAANFEKRTYECNFFFDAWNGTHMETYYTGTQDVVRRRPIDLRRYTADQPGQMPDCDATLFQHLGCVPNTCEHICDTDPMDDDECLDRDQAVVQDRIRLRLEEYQAMLERAIDVHGYTGTFPDDSHFKWTLFSAIVFCVTAFTLIGYGHMSPRSDFSRLFIIIYSLLGIVLFLMFTAKVGRLFAKGVRYIYTRCMCYYCFKKRDDTEDSYYKDAKGNLSLVPVNDGGQQVQTEEERLAAEIARLENMMEDDLDQILDDDLRAPVPLSLTLLLVCIYLLSGAVLFMEWEDWDLAESIYFTFVTLVTIGFGDLVPGLKKAVTTTGRIKLTVTVVYIIAGLAVVGMGLDMLVYSYKSSIKKVGKTVGVIEQKQEYDEYGDEIVLADWEERANAKNAYGKVKV